MSVHAAPGALPKQFAPTRAPSPELRPSRDRFETEAEHAAGDVLRSGDRAPTLSSLPRGSRPEGLAAPAEVSEVVGSPGLPLGGATRRTMERQFRSDFSHVRIHADAPAAASARAIQATAYTAGSHIVFGHGAYTPETPRGRHILAHELAHVVQQRGATTPPAAIQRLAWYESIAVFFGAEGNFGDKELLAYLDKITQAREHEGSFDSDNKARAIVRRWKAGQAEFKLDPIQKALLIQDMQDGATLDDDEEAILDLLELSDIAALRIMFGAGKLNVGDLESDIDGAEYKRLKRFFAARFRGGRDAVAKGDVEPQGEPGKNAPIFKYDAADVKLRLDSASSPDAVDGIGAEIFALAPAERDKAMQQLGRERMEIARKLDGLDEQVANETDQDKSIDLQLQAASTKGTLSNYDRVLQQVSRDLALTTSGKDLSKTVAPDAAQKAEITKALKPDVNVDSNGVAQTFDNSEEGKKKYKSALEDMLAKLIKAFWNQNVKGRGPDEHKSPAKTHNLSEFERIGKASKAETDKVFGDYYDASKHPELKADSKAGRGNIHDQFADIDAELTKIKDDEPAKQAMARRMVMYFFQARGEIRAVNRRFNASPEFDEHNTPLNDEAKIVNQLADEITSDPDRAQKINHIQRGWVAAAKDGDVRVQIFRKDTPAKDRVFLWDMFQTLIHEYIHTLRAKEYTDFALKFGNSPAYNTLIEGVDSFLDEVVWENVAPRVNTPEIREAVESPEDARKPPIPMPQTRRYESYAEAVKLVNIVGIRNLYAAYFKGEVAKIGG